MIKYIKFIFLYNLIYFNLILAVEKKEDLQRSTSVQFTQQANETKQKATDFYEKEIIKFSEEDKAKFYKFLKIWLSSVHHRRSSIYYWNELKKRKASDQPLENLENIHKTSFTKLKELFIEWLDIYSILANQYPIMKTHVFDDAITYDEPSSVIYFTELQILLCNYFIGKIPKNFE